jgi:hypothetical protein
LLEGKNVNLKIIEKEDLPLFAEWMNKPEFYGEYNPLRQMSRTEAEKRLETPVELRPFIIEKKDGSKIGFVAHYHELWVDKWKSVMPWFQMKEAKPIVLKR